MSAESFAQIREALEFQCDEHATLHPTEPALDALDLIEQQAAQMEQALDGWERDGHVFVRIADVRAAFAAPEETA